MLMKFPASFISFSKIRNSKVCVVLNIFMQNIKFMLGENVFKFIRGKERLIREGEKEEAVDGS